MPRQPRSVSSTLNELLRTITNPTRSCNEVKFQKIVDCYNQRGPEDPENNLAGVRLFVWRTFPRTDNTKTGRKQTNIHMLDCVQIQEGSTVITPLPANVRQWVTEQFGGGRYRVSLNDKDYSKDGPAGNKVDQVAQTAIKVDHIEHAPILDPRELDESDPETQQWVVREMALGKLLRNEEAVLQMPGDKSSPVTASPAGPNFKDNTGGLAAVAMEALKQRSDGSSEQAHKANIQMVTDTAKQMIEQARSGQPGPELLISLAQVLKGDSGGGAAIMIPLISTMIQEQSKMQMQLFELLLERQRPVATVEDTNSGMAVVEKLLDLAERTANPKGSGWLETIKEMLPALLPLFLARGLAGNGAAPDMSGLAALMGNRGEQPAAMDTGAGTIPRITITPRMMQDLAARAWLCMSRQQDGTDLANGIEVFLSPQHYDVIRALGKDQLMAQLMTTTMAANFQNAGPAFGKFVDEFLSYGEEAPAPESGVPPGGAPGAAAHPAGAV